MVTLCLYFIVEFMARITAPWIYRKDGRNEKGLKVMLAALLAVGVAGCNPAKKKKVQVKIKSKSRIRLVSEYESYRLICSTSERLL